MTPGLLEPAPLPRPPGHVTPSGYAVLKECPLRFAWQNSAEPRRLPVGPAAHLGTVAHKVLEWSARGRIETWPEGGRRAWETAVEAEHQAMTADWLERPFVPLQRSARRYEEVRLATLRRVTRVAPGTDRRGTSRYEVEPPMMTADGLVRGQSDVIVETASGALIRDHKTGEIFDRQPGKQLKPAYRSQLLLYAVLYQAMHGAWPLRLELVPPVGTSVEVPYTQEEAQATLSDAVSRLLTIRTAVSAGAASGLATPGEHCGRCPYRPVCPARPPAGGMAEDLSGTFESGRTSRPGVRALSVLSSQKPLTVTGLSEDRERNPALGLLQQGDTVFVFNTRKVSESLYLATDYTVLYKAH